MYVGMRLLLMGILLLSKILNVARLLMSINAYSLHFAVTDSLIGGSGLQSQSQEGVFVENQADAGTINRT